MPSLTHIEKLFFGESVDEQSENVIDHIVRKLLLHKPQNDALTTPKSGQIELLKGDKHKRGDNNKNFDYSWSDPSFLKQLYSDKLFPKMVEKMYGTVITECFKTTTSISQKITLTKATGEYHYDLMSWSQYKYLLDNLDDKTMQFRDKEMFLWSFCVIIATEIKYLELNTLINTKDAINYRSTNFEKDRYFHYRELQGLIQKFVLEMSEPSAARNLWPWYDSCINDTIKDFDELNEILHHNGEYILNHHNNNNNNNNEQQQQINDTLSPISINSFKYPNIRYIRKCAANQLLNERLTAKQLFDIHKLVIKNNIGINDASQTPHNQKPTGSLKITPSLLTLRTSIGTISNGFDDEFDNEPITKEGMELIQNFQKVLNTIFVETKEDSKTIEIRKMLETAIKNRNDIQRDKKHQKHKRGRVKFNAKGDNKDEAVMEHAISLRDHEMNDKKKEEEEEEKQQKGFSKFYGYFSELPIAFKSKQPKSITPHSAKSNKENICNKYDLLLLCLGLEYGFDLKKIKKLLYIYKESVSWEFRQFFKVKIRVLLRMKYLCILILENTEKSYFNKGVMISNSVVFSDGLQYQRHLKYCVRFDQYDIYGGGFAVTTPKSQEMQEIKQGPSIEINAINALSAKSAVSDMDDMKEKNLTVIISDHDEEEQKGDESSPIHRVHIIDKSTVDSEIASTLPFGAAQVSIYRKRSSLDIGDGYEYQALLLRILPDRDIENELRDCIHFYEPYGLQDDIIAYIIDKIRTKTDHRVLDALWRALIIILSQLPLIDALRLLSKHWDAIRNKQISNVRYINAMIDALIRCSAFPIATALFLSAYLEERAADDITRCDQWLEIARKCEKIAESEVEKINSDHVLCLLLYAPTDIQLMNTLDLAIRYNRVQFLNHPYISGVLENIWSNGNPMLADPFIPGSLFTTETGGLIQSIWRNPTQFVYSAFGIALIRCVLFTIFLCLITLYATANECENLHLQPIPPKNVTTLVWEVIILAVVFALIWAELAEILRDTSVYLSKISNTFDFISCCIWLIIIAMKAWSRICFNISMNCCLPYDDGVIQSIYYGLWAVVIVFMFMKVTIIFQFTALMGRFLKTVSLLLHDIFTFLVTAAVFFVGFLFCLYILANAGGNTTGTAFDTINGTTIFLYDIFFSLNGPDNLQWKDDLDNDFQIYSIVALVICYQILAAILLLNLLIAMMSDTYTGVFKRAVAETNFFKIEQTTACVRPYGRLIGGFSFFVLIFCSLGYISLLILQYLVYVCSGSRWLFDVNIFETWRWIYDDFWTMHVLCPCCKSDTNDNDNADYIKHNKSQSRSHHDYTESELVLSLESNSRKPSWSTDVTLNNNKNVKICKLDEIAPHRVNTLIIDKDYRKDDIDNKSNDRKRCLWCCVKQRRKSRKLREEINNCHAATIRTRNERKTKRLQSLHQAHKSLKSDILNAQTAKSRDKNNLLYNPANDDEDDDDDDVINEQSSFMNQYNKSRGSNINIDIDIDSNFITRSVHKLTRYSTNDKRMCRRELERNRRRNKVRKKFSKSKKKETSCWNRLKNWYSNWEFIDNETFCPNCFIGSPSNSIQEYGTIDGFICLVEKQFEYVIKRDDRMALRRSLKDSILCQRCFYPLHVNNFHNERKTRFQILVEITSTYYFYFIAWIPLQILIIPFGLIGLIRHKAKEYGSAQSFLWKIEETKNFHDIHGDNSSSTLIQNYHQKKIDKSNDLYSNKVKIAF